MLAKYCDLQIKNIYIYICCDSRTIAKIFWTKKSAAWKSGDTG